MKKTFLTLVSAIALFAIPHGAGAQEKHLDHDIYDRWNTIYEQQVSPNGNWITYEVRPAQGDGALYIHDTRTGAKREVERGTGARLFGNQRWMAYRVNPTYKEMRDAQLNNTPRHMAPKQKVYLLNLMTGDTTNITDTEGLVLIEKSPRIAFRMKVPKEVAKPAPTPAAPAALAAAGDSLRASGQQPQMPPQMMQRPPQQGGEEVVFCIVDLEKKDTLARIKDLGMFRFTKDGNRLIYTSRKDTVTTINMWNNGATRQLLDLGKGKLGQIVLDDENENQIAYTVQPNDTVKRPYELWQMSLTTFKPRKVEFSIEGMELAAEQNDRISFSPKGGALMFSFKQPERQPVKDTLLSNEKFMLELWSHTDTVVQSQQYVSAQQMGGRGGAGMVPVIYYLKENFGRRMDQGSFRYVNIPPTIDDARFFVVSDSRRYQSVGAWDITNPRDYSLYWPREDRREEVLTNVAGGVVVSPTTRWLVWFDTESGAWFSLDPDTKERRNMTADIDVPLWNELYDWPGTAKEAGAGGWMRVGTGSSMREYFMVYDRYDIWVLDPSGRRKPQRITDGRPTSTTFRPLITDRRASYLNEGTTIFLNSNNEETRDEGFWTITVDRSGNLAKKPIRHIEGPWKLTLWGKAKDAGRVLWSRQSYTEYPDLYTSAADFRNEVRLSDANPEMRDYLWGSAELIRWTSKEGKPMKGILYLPGGYEPGKKYPGLIYFYEKVTKDLNNFHNPAPSWSVVVPPMFTSNGYAILMPDIDYTYGEPCISALKATVSAAEELVRRGICEADRIGIQGQSWGGTQLNYIVTQTDAFRCASSGAGEADMISGYGDIRWDSGSPRTFLYETGQTRLGGTLWEMPENYIRNSAIFHLPNVTTPILLRHSNNDGAVPYVQAMEMFNGLRRLGKPVWLLNYVNGGHNLTGWTMRKDFAVRMQQFFDHYLKDAPAPRWMVEGISYEERATQLKLDLVE